MKAPFVRLILGLAKVAKGYQTSSEKSQKSPNVTSKVANVTKSRLHGKVCLLPRNQPGKHQRLTFVDGLTVTEALRKKRGLGRLCGRKR